MSVGYRWCYVCSSRFTDSKKYEEDFVDCFQLKERRAGEVCNACVLLVKRWKKLPPGSQRHWRHVSRNHNLCDHRSNVLYWSLAGNFMFSININKIPKLNEFLWKSIAKHLFLVVWPVCTCYFFQFSGFVLLNNQIKKCFNFVLKAEISTSKPGISGFDES